MGSRKQLMDYIVVENQQMHQNDHFIVMSSQTLLHVLVYQRHHQGASSYDPHKLLICRCALQEE
jgi:hypothetical protein